MIVKFTGEQIIEKHYFSKIADEWAAEAFPKLAYRTLSCYTAGLKHAKMYFKNSYIEDITHFDIKKYIEDYLVSKRNLAKKTVKNYRIVLSMIFKYAVVNDIIQSNIVKDISIPKGLREIPRELPTDSDIEKVKINLNVDFGLFYYIVLYTGLRRGEVLALEYEDFDWKNNLIKINKSIYHKHNKPVLKEPKTEAGERFVPFLEPLKKVIDKNKSGLLFCDEKGNYLIGSQVELGIKKYQKATGVKGTPHQVRHEYATYLYEANLPDKDISTILGHKDISTTKNIYIHIRQKQLMKSTNILNEYLS